jgi:hypothetical protein
MVDVVAKSPAYLSLHHKYTLHAGLAHPVRQCRARDGQTSTTEDLFLSVQRRVIGEPGHHHVSQQTGVGMPLSITCTGAGPGPVFHTAGRPISTHIQLNRKHALRVIQLIADIFTDALKLAAARALSVARLVMGHDGRELRRKGGTLGLRRLHRPVTRVIQVPTSEVASGQVRLRSTTQAWPTKFTLVQAPRRQLDTMLWCISSFMRFARRLTMRYARCGFAAPNTATTVASAVSMPACLSMGSVAIQMASMRIVGKDHG